MVSSMGPARANPRGRVHGSPKPLPLGLHPTLCDHPPNHEPPPAPPVGRAL